MKLTLQETVDIFRENLTATKPTSHGIPAFGQMGNYNPGDKKRKPYYEPALQDDYISGIESQLDEKIRSKSFRMRDFEEAIEHGEAIEYCRQHLKELGCGSSRCTFLLTSKTVLKVARDDDDSENEKTVQVKNADSAGRAQNEVEARISKKAGDIVAKVLRSSDHYDYVVSELVHQFKDWGSEDPDEETHGIELDKFEDIVGIPWELWKYAMEFADNEDLSAEHLLMAAYIEAGYDNGEDFEYSVEDLRVYDDKEFEERFGMKKPTIEDFSTQGNPRKAITHLEKILDFAYAYDLQHGDLVVSDHYGVTANGRLVILDYGFNEDVRNSYYMHESEIDALEEALAGKLQ